MEAAAEGAVGLSEARDGSPLSVTAASDDGDTVVGVSYGMDAADMGTLTPLDIKPHPSFNVVFHYPDIHFSFESNAVTRKSRLIYASKESVS